MKAHRPNHTLLWILLGVLSLGLHVFLILPYGIARLLMPAPLPEEPKEPELVFLDPALDLPFPEQSLPNQPQPKPVKLAENTLPKPEVPEKEKPKELPKPPKLVEVPPPKVDPIKPPDAHLKMVEQNQFQEEKDNADAKYLAEKNHRTTRDNQARDTNLVKNQSGGEHSSKNENQSEQKGDPRKQIAELTEHKGNPRSPSSPRTAPKRASQTSATTQPKMSPLAMRTKASSPQASPAKPLTEPGPNPGPAPGPLPPANNAGSRDPKPAPNLLAGPLLPQGPLLPSNSDYEKIVGKEVSDAQQKAAREAKPSATPGRWDRFLAKQEALRSSLENFTPGIEIGTESELGTRAHPFAAYIATIHRRIHKQWAFHYLASLDHQVNGGPYPLTAHTKVLIVLNEDGTLCKHNMTHTSGYTGFDTAAWDAVDMASPFPAPPQSLRSPNGKTYITWSFYRDNRQCATDFVDAHVVNKAEERCTDVVSKPMSPEQSNEENKQGGDNDLPTAPGFRF